MLYEITLTLRPQMYRFSTLDQFTTLTPILRDVFNRDSFKTPYRTSLIAELTQEDNVHYHGIVELKDFKDRHQLVERIRKHNKILGKKTITQLINYGIWVDYLNKNISVTKQLIKDPIVFDDHNVLCDPQYRFIESLS